MRLLLFILLIWVLGALVLRLAEGPANPEFNTLSKALWNIAVYLFSGLDSGVPQTASGRIVVTIVLVLSLGVVALFTGAVASFLVESRLGKGKRMPGYDLKNHVVICNWNDKGVPIIRELHAPIVQEKRPVVVVSRSGEAAELPEQDDAAEFKDVYLVKGDPASEIVLKRANVASAFSVIVLADPAERDLADAKSILIAMAIRSICTAAGAAKTHVCVENVSPENLEHLRRAGADEVVSASDFAMMLLSQAALSHGLSEVYRNLLTISSESNEVYILPVPKEAVGKSFAELGALMLENRDPDNPAILIGAVTADGMVVNPRQGQFTRFSEGDKAVVIAFEQPMSLL